ncbi:MAG: HPr kinase/phosphatase C-terminal domain-containing protein [Alphaproteobacteria bacterium]
MIVVHATCVEVGGGAVLLRGPSAAGKSDLALRLIDEGAKLVADDQVQLTAVRGELIASAPVQLSGKIEVRGIGIFDLADERVSPRARVVLVADLGPSADVARLPNRTSCRLESIDVPLIAVAPFEASSPAKIRLALHAWRAAGRNAQALNDA